MTKRSTDLDHQLQEIALVDWPAFVAMVGEDAINKAKVCLLRKRKKSYCEISMKLGLSYKQARNACSNCKNQA